MNAAQQTAFYRQLGENIRACRKRTELSQDGLAKLIGLTRTSLTNIENGRQHPPLHTLCEIVEKLNVEISALLPRSFAATEGIDITTMAGIPLGAEEVAFIQSAIGIKQPNKGSHGDTGTENSSDGGGSSR